MNDNRRGCKESGGRIILINYTGRNGGGALDAYELAKALVECGEKVVAIISSECSNVEYWKKLSFEKLILIDTYKNKTEFLFRTIWFYIYTRWKIYFEIRTYNIEFILCPMIAFWTNMINTMFHNTPICIINHDPQPHSGDKSVALLNLFGMQKVYRSAAVIFVHSKKFLHYVEETYQKAGRTFYIPLGRQTFYRNLKTKTSCIQYDINKINFLFFGRIESYKGLNILAQAYEKVSSECGNVTLTIAGSGDLGECRSLYDRLSDVTIVNRWIQDTEVEGFFNGPNVVLIVPYTDATQSGPLLIALDYAVPVIATDTGGLREQILEGKTGVLVKPGNPESLAEAMTAFARNPELIKVLSAGAQAKLEELEWDGIGKKICKEMRKLYGNNSNSF